jgi:hypothetical protein
VLEPMLASSTSSHAFLRVQAALFSPRTLTCTPLFHTPQPPHDVFQLLARHVMTPNPIVLHETVRAGVVYDMLASCKHNGFAVIGAAHKVRPFRPLTDPRLR